jgi:hypothetical protein
MPPTASPASKEPTIPEDYLAQLVTHLAAVVTIAETKVAATAPTRSVDLLGRACRRGTAMGVTVTITNVVSTGRKMAFRPAPLVAKI